MTNQDAVLEEVQRTPGVHADELYKRLKRRLTRAQVYYALINLRARGAILFRKRCAWLPEDPKRRNR